MPKAQEFGLRLPAEKSSMDRLRQLEPEDRDRFLKDLLGAVWQADEEDALPPKISHLIRGWVAHIRFEENPDNRQYRDDLRAQTSV